MSTNAGVTRSVPSFKQQRNPISRKTVEVVISRSVAIFGVVFALQTLPGVISQWHQAAPAWSWSIAIALYASILVCLVASLTGRHVRSSHCLVAVVYLVALLSWPFAVVDPAALDDTDHWLYYLLTVATATAAIGFSAPVGTTYLVVAPVMYGFIAVTPAGGRSSANEAVLDSLYSILLGGVIMVIVTMLRSAAQSVDVAQAAALDRYAHAVRQHATEVERVQVDSIVHDSVLTTFISAARAYTPEAKALAATMAGNAIGHLREAALVSPDDGSTVRLSAVARRISESARTVGAPFELRMRNIGTRSMPVLAAEAVYSASVQAMINSLQHAPSGEAVSRWLTIRGVAPAGIEVEVGDTGTGFSVVEVPSERLGLRVSIIDRVAGAGGVAEIDSVVGEGTVITIRWPAPDAARGRASGLPEARSETGSDAGTDATTGGVS